MAYNKVEQYGESENILDSAVGLVVKTHQATQGMGGDDKVIKAGALVAEKRDAYTKVTETSGKNPQTEGWYKVQDGEYVKATESTPDGGTTYYTKGSVDAPVGVVFEDYDMEDYGERPISVVVQGRLKAGKVSTEALAQKEAFAKQGLYIV